MTSRLDRIKDWALLAKSSRYSASAIAQECGISPRQLERYFQEHMKKAPHQWLRELRMRRAIELLRENVSVKATAQELCYKDAAHFCRDFKSYYGRTPGQTAALSFPLPEVRVAFRQ
ncbi:MAG: helix-turn-helix transcriptional regulator [Verrucomicrobiota bacterium]